MPLFCDQSREKLPEKKNEFEVRTATCGQCQIGAGPLAAGPPSGLASTLPLP